MIADMNVNFDQRINGFIANVRIRIADQFRNERSQFRQHQMRRAQTERKAQIFVLFKQYSSWKKLFKPQKSQ